MNKYFVKFVRWNENTLSSLINKTIKFSTTYEFNEFRYISDANNRQIQEVNDILKEELGKCNFLNNLMQLSKERCTEECYRKISEFLKDGEPKGLLDSEYCPLWLLDENLAFSNVGMFCISNIDVFKDDSAQLMFAHYAKNLSGLALIYEIGSKTKIDSIDYDSDSKGSSGNPTRSIEWYKGQYDDVSDFLSKSKKWQYEKESRIFDQPGVKNLDAYSISLKAILYTARFAGEKETLFNINNCIYKNQLKIEKIYAAHGKFHFMMEEFKCNTIEFFKTL